MKTSNLVAIAAASPSVANKLLDTRQENQNRVYYPPQAGSNDVVDGFTVHAGDTLNITWDTTYPNVDLRIEAYAAHSNFTVTPFYNPGLPSASYFEYTLQPKDYLINDTSLGIAAFFRLSDSADSTQFVRTQNFTIEQPDHPTRTRSDGIPSDASTWTGSVTLFKSVGTVVASSTGTGNAVAATTTDSSSKTGTRTGTRTGGAGATNTSAYSKSSGSLSTAASAGIGVGVALGVIAVVGVIAVLLLRNWRKKKAAAAAGRMAELANREKPYEYGQGEHVRFGGGPYYQEYAYPQQTQPTHEMDAGMSPHGPQVMSELPGDGPRR